MSLQPNSGASSSRLQQRRPSRTSVTDTTDAVAFRARLGSSSQQQHYASSSNAIVEDDKEPQEPDRSKHDDSKAASDEETPVTPPILASTYPPTAEPRPSTAAASSSSRDAALSDLPPIDGGAAAWRFLVCGFVIWSMVWGIAYSYGSFQDYHEHNPESPFYGQSVTSISAVGTLVIGCQHFVPLLLRGFTATYAHLIRKMVMVSLVLSALSILIASFSTSIAMLIAFQGVFFGITSGVLLMPVVLYLGQWFDKKRGFATSAIFMGSGVGGVVFPLVLNALLTSIGFAWTMRVWALAQLLLNGSALYLIKPRLPSPRSSKKLPASFKELARSLAPGDLRPLLTPIALIYVSVLPSVLLMVEINC